MFYVYVYFINFMYYICAFAFGFYCWICLPFSEHILEELELFFSFYADISLSVVLFFLLCFVYAMFPFMSLVVLHSTVSNPIVLYKFLFT